MVDVKVNTRSAVKLLWVCMTSSAQTFTYVHENELLLNWAAESHAGVLCGGKYLLENGSNAERNCNCSALGGSGQ